MSGWLKRKLFILHVVRYNSVFGSPPHARHVSTCDRFLFMHSINGLKTSRRYCVIFSLDTLRDVDKNKANNMKIT